MSEHLVGADVGKGRRGQQSHPALERGLVTRERWWHLAEDRGRGGRAGCVTCAWAMRTYLPLPGRSPAAGTPARVACSPVPAPWCQHLPPSRFPSLSSHHVPGRRAFSRRFASPRCRHPCRGATSARPAPPPAPTRVCHPWHAFGNTRARAHLCSRVAADVHRGGLAVHTPPCAFPGTQAHTLPCSKLSPPSPHRSPPQ